MTEIQDLINEVHKYPCLWDLDDLNYQNKIFRDLAWEKVCRVLIDNWDELNVEEKKKLCEEKKKRWNNLRDGYRKYLNRIKNTPTGSGALPPKKYTYMDDLYFLTPIFNKSRPREGSLPLSPHQSHENNEENAHHAEIDENIEEDEMERNRRRIIRRDESASQSKTKRARGEDNIPQQILNIIQRKTNAEPNYHDEDSQFLLSFRNDLKSMSRSQKIKFKLGMIQLIQSITESRPNSSENFPQSSSSQIIYTPTVSPSPDFSEPSFSNNNIARQIILSSGTSNPLSNFPNTNFSNNADNRHGSPFIYMSSSNPSPHFSQTSPVMYASSTQNLSHSNISMECNPATYNSAIASSQSEEPPNNSDILNQFIVFTNKKGNNQ